MTYTVSSGTLNPTQLNSVAHVQFTVSCKKTFCGSWKVLEFFLNKIVGTLSLGSGVNRFQAFDFFTIDTSNWQCVVQHHRPVCALFHGRSTEAPNPGFNAIRFCFVCVYLQPSVLV